MSGSFEGIKVIELGHYAAVPSACAILADWGAEVIKIETTKGGDAMRGLRAIEDVEITEVNIWFEQMNRNKKSVAIDLSQEGGREIIYKLVQRSDVFVSNFMPKVLKRFALDYDTLSRLNPRLVYVSFSGYGLTGPDKDKPGYDYAAFWARSGIMEKVSEPSRPPRPQRPGLGDNMTSMGLAGAIASALFVRERNGLGQKVDMCLFHAGVWSLGIDVVTSLYMGKEITKTDRRNVRNPLWNTYETKDGRWMQIIMLQTDRYWPRFCKAIGREDLQYDSKFDSHLQREKNSSELISILDEVMASKTYTEWDEVFRQYDLVYGLCQTVTDVVSDPQAWENALFVEVDHPVARRIKLIASPVKFSKTPASVRSCAPELGQHTEEVLQKLGYNWDDIVNFKNQQVIL